VPNSADSLLALTQLNAIVVEHTRQAVNRDVSRRLALGIRLDRLPPLYDGERREEARYARRVQSDLEAINYNALGQDDYLTLLAVHWELGSEAEAPVYRTLDYSAVVPVASAIPSIARAMSQHPIEEAADVERYLYLLDNLGQYFPEVRHTLVEQARKGILIPRPALDTVATFLQQFRQPASQSPFRLAEERLTRIDSASRVAVVQALSQKIESDINVQIDSLVDYLRGPYRSVAPNDSAIGLSRYPGGQAYYTFLLRRTTTLDVSPGDLYTYGVREVERISAAMMALRRKLNFAGSDSAFRASLRADVRHVVTSPSDFEARVERALAVLRDTVRAQLGIALMDSLVLVPRISGALAGAARMTLRESDAIDPRYRLEYASDLVTHVPGYVIPALVAREIVPGRFALLSTVRSSDSLATIRQLMRFPGFVDGWSEHARGLAGELGFYADNYEAYGALMLELEAAARLVCDLGIHFGGWTYSQAVRYLRLHSIDASTAESDVLRIAVAEPARAVAAKVGSRELGGQRAWVRRELGDAFNDGALQREVLRVGVLPLPLLSQHLAWWVWTQKTGDRRIGG
jgi:uncharacterized protein (DUF885 family)